MTESGPRLYDRIINLLRTDLEDKSLVIRWVAWRLKLLYEIIEKFWWDNCPTFAASLAYTTLLALAPLTAVSLSILSSMRMAGEVNILDFVIQSLTPNMEIARQVSEKLNIFAENAASVSIFGVAALVLFSIWVMSTVESAFNMIWKVDKPRPLINQFVAYWSTLTFAPILIAMSMIVTAKIQALVMSEDWAEYTYLQGFIMKVIPYALTWTAFFLLYRLIPNTSVYFKPAWIGSIVAGTFFEVAKWVFDYYLRNWATYTAVYGALATIPIFLFWLYVTWLIVLLGSVIAYAIQYPKEIKSEKHEGFDRTKFQNYYALRILVEATRAFESGHGALDPDVVRPRLEITGEFYGEILRKLKKLGLIEFVESSEERFLLKKPPADIKVADILTRLGSETLSVSPEPLDSDRKVLADIFQTIHDSINTGTNNLDLLKLTNKLEEQANSSHVVELVKEKTETA